MGFQCVCLAINTDGYDFFALIVHARKPQLLCFYLTLMSLVSSSSIAVLSLSGTKIQSPLMTVTSTIVRSANNYLYACKVTLFLSIHPLRMQLLSSRRVGSWSVLFYKCYFATSFGCVSRYHIIHIVFNFLGGPHFKLRSRMEPQRVTR